MRDGLGGDVVGPRLYPIGPGAGYFDAGVTADGRQVLMGLDCPEVVAVFFDASGGLIGHESRRLEFLPRGGGKGGADGVYDINDERIPSRVAAWQADLGFRPSLIRVKPFFLDELGIGITDYPDHFGEILVDPAASDAEKDDVRDSIRLWDADGQFVLYWGNDYWLDDSGAVVSS